MFVGAIGGLLSNLWDEWAVLPLLLLGCCATDWEGWAGTWSLVLLAAAPMSACVEQRTDKHIYSPAHTQTQTQTHIAATQKSHVHIRAKATFHAHATFASATPEHQYLYLISKFCASPLPSRLWLFVSRCGNTYIKRRSGGAHDALVFRVVRGLQGCLSKWRVYGWM